MKTQEQIQAAIKAQEKLCKEKNLPDFAPGDGHCFDCGRNIYQDYQYEGRDGTSHITGCPHCNYSFCE